MRFLLVAALSLLCVGCAEERPYNPQSLNAGSYLDPAEVNHLKLMANQGDALAANELADYYDYWCGDSRETIVWLRKAASYGNVEAEYNLGIQLGGLSNSKSQTSEARGWIEKAAQGGYKPAIDKLAKLRRGEGI